MINRLDLDQNALDFITQQRAYHRHEADVGADDYLDEKHRRNRAEVLGPNCRVKEDDDILYNGTVLRVIGPARDEGWLYVLNFGPFGLQDIAVEGGTATGDRAFITDRAPADENEEPLPIFIDPPAEPPIEPEAP